MDSFNLLKQGQSNKKYSRKLLAVIMYTAIAGVSFRFAYDNITPVNTNPSKTRVEVQSEQPTPFPSTQLTVTPISGSGSQADDIVTGSGAYLDIPEMHECGTIDANKNGVVDIEDFTEFRKVYMDMCLSEAALGSDKCGLKDFNNDQIVNIADFINFSEKYRISECE
jgi:hypothetical protein